MRDIIFENKRHFNEFRQAEEKIASNILTDRLNMLEREGLLKKDTDPAHKQKVIYSLTEKSIDLLAMLVEAIVWSLKYNPVDRVRYKPAIDFVNSGEEGKLRFREHLLKLHGIRG